MGDNFIMETDPEMDTGSNAKMERKWKLNKKRMVFICFIINKNCNKTIINRKTL